MRVICIEPHFFQLLNVKCFILTVGKIYDVISVVSEPSLLRVELTTSDEYIVECDDGRQLVIPIKYFITIDEYRDMKISSLINL